MRGGCIQTDLKSGKRGDACSTQTHTCCSRGAPIPCQSQDSSTFPIHRASAVSYLSHTFPLLLPQAGLRRSSVQAAAAIAFRSPRGCPGGCAPTTAAPCCLHGRVAAARTIGSARVLDGGFGACRPWACRCRRGTCRYLGGCRAACGGGSCGWAGAGWRVRHAPKSVAGVQPLGPCGRRRSHLCRDAVHAGVEFRGVGDDAGFGGRLSA